MLSLRLDDMNEVSGPSILCCPVDFKILRVGKKTETHPLVLCRSGWLMMGIQCAYADSGVAEIQQLSMCFHEVIAAMAQVTLQEEQPFKRRKRFRPRSWNTRQQAAGLCALVIKPLTSEPDVTGSAAARRTHGSSSNGLLVRLRAEGME